MKRLTAILITALGLFLMCPSNTMAAGTIAASGQKIYVDGRFQRFVLTLTCTADAAAATFPTTGDAIINPATYGITGWYLYSAETNPGTTQPTDNYDITLIDPDGVDVAGSQLLNRDTLNSELAYLSSVGYPIITGNWTVTIANNAVNSAVVVLKLTFTMN